MFNVGDEVRIVGLGKSPHVNFSADVCMALNGTVCEVVSSRSPIGSYGVKPIKGPLVGAGNLGVLESNLVLNKSIGTLNINGF